MSDITDIIEESETETESESEDENEEYYRDEDVFLGAVTFEEIRVNKRIGGRRTTIANSRFSELPALATEQTEQLPDKQDVLLHQIILIQSVWRTYKSIKLVNILKKEKRKQNAICALTQVIPTMKLKVDESTKKYTRGKAVDVMTSMAASWKAKADTAKEHHLRMLQLAKKLHETKEKHEMEQQVISKVTPEAISVMKEKVEIHSENPLQSVTNRLERLRNARILLRQQLESATGKTQEIRTQVNNSRFNDITSQLNVNKFTQTSKLLEEKRNVLSDISLKRQALLQSDPSAVSVDKENTVSN